MICIGDDMSLVPTLEELKKEIIESVLNSEQITYLKEGHRVKERKSNTGWFTLLNTSWNGGGVMISVNDGHDTFNIFNIRRGEYLTGIEEIKYISTYVDVIKTALCKIVNQIQEDINEQNDSMKALIELHIELHKSVE